MSRMPSEKTQLANAKRMIRDLQKEVKNLSGEVRLYRVRASHAEQASAEWKQRFDELLKFRKALSITE